MSYAARFSTWAEVSLQAIEDNVAWFVRHSRARVMAVVKADGYGHGALPVARAALRAGATWLAVARAEEAFQLRQAGLSCPILLLGHWPPEPLAELIAQEISLALWSGAQAEQAASVAGRVGRPARVHLKVDTGMGRLGVQAEEALPLVRRLAAMEGLTFEGLFTHFARADEADPRPTDEQERRLAGLLQALDAEGLRPPLVHAANSAASLTRPHDHFDLIRVGIAIYGLHPSAECPLPAGFSPALYWKTQLSQVKVLPPGRGLSYGHEYVTTRQERIGTLPVGYADGFRRTAGNQVLVGGKVVPVVGRVCMDQCLVQLDAVPEARVGDEVVLIGEQGGARRTAEQVAACWGTINYEVTCAIGKRVPRVYLGEGEPPP